MKFISIWFYHIAFEPYQKIYRSVFECFHYFFSILCTLYGILVPAFLEISTCFMQINKSHKKVLNKGVLKRNIMALKIISLSKNTKCTIYLVYFFIRQLQSNLKGGISKPCACNFDISGSWERQLKALDNSVKYAMVPFVKGQLYSICQTFCWTVFSFYH